MEYDCTKGRESGGGGSGWMEGAGLSEKKEFTHQRTAWNRPSQCTNGPQMIGYRPQCHLLSPAGTTGSPVTGDGCKNWAERSADAEKKVLDNQSLIQVQASEGNFLNFMCFSLKPRS